MPLPLYHLLFQQMLAGGGDYSLERKQKRALNQLHALVSLMGDMHVLSGGFRNVPLVQRKLLVLRLRVDVKKSLL